MSPLSHRQGSPALLKQLGLIVMLYSGSEQRITAVMSDTADQPPDQHVQSPIDRDAALMRRIADGAPDASRHVVDTHLAAVHSFAWRMLGDRHEAEDVAQESFLKLWRQSSKWKPKAQISTWLRRVAYNACIDRLRKAKPTDDIDDLALADATPDP